MQRTAPAVSFTVSHRALAMRSNRALLGNNMTSWDRQKAAWSETPIHWAVLDFKGLREWVVRMTYELGLRDFERSNKFGCVMLYVLMTWSICASAEVGSVFWYHIIYRTWPEHSGRNGMAGTVEYGKKHGRAVWYADGKFTKPLYHINPPYFTMTADEL